MDAIVPPPATLPHGLAGGGEPFVHMRGLTLTVPSAAGTVNILRGIDLDIVRGEALGVVGASGSGKTSLLMVLAGLEAATGGTLRIDGADLRRMNEDALARLRRDRIGIVFQAFHLIASMTALENVAIPLELAGHRDAMARARHALAGVGLAHRLTHLPGQLSGGEQQRVALARAFAPRPSLLLADEPTGNLDADTGRQVMDTLFALHAETDSTLMLITHDPELAARCSRTIRIADGRVVGQGVRRHKEGQGALPPGPPLGSADPRPHDLESGPTAVGLDSKSWGLGSADPSGGPGGRAPWPSL